jgi:hypothetical protein
MDLEVAVVYGSALLASIVLVGLVVSNFGNADNVIYVDSKK